MGGAAEWRSTTQRTKLRDSDRERPLRGGPPPSFSLAKARNDARWEQCLQHRISEGSAFAAVVTTEAHALLTTLFMTTTTTTISTATTIAMANAIAIAIAAVAILNGCAAPTTTTDEELESTHQEITSGRTITPNSLLTDSNVEGDQQVSASDVQSFLATQKSALAGYSEGGRTAAEIIAAEAKSQTISPVYMLARLETESSIVRSGSLYKVNQATGCGCPDGSGCSAAYSGFTAQIQCAAKLMRGYLRSIDTNGATITGWQVGVGRSTSDPCWVVPANRATAALYTYTPWVGAYGIGCGTAQWGGSSLVATLYNLFRSQIKVSGSTGTASPSTPPAATKCVYGDGLYCGGNGVTGDASTLYQCTAGALTISKQCASGCKHMPNGYNDRCF